MVMKILFLVGLIVGVYSASSSPYYTIYSRGRHYEVKNVNDPKGGIATAFYNVSMNSTGWDYLNIKSNKDSSDFEQMYAAGYLEGVLTADLTYAYYQSLYISEYNSTDLSDNVINWLDLNKAYMLQNIKEHPTDPYWTHVALVLQQMQGVLDGYNSVASESKQLTLYNILLLNMDGDMSDLQEAVDGASYKWDDRSVIERYVFNSHCSVLVKVAEDFSDLYVGHTTWSGYEEMLRIYKTYDFPLSTKKASQVTTFSGYPGVLSSVDDYYLLDTGLVVTETTNGVMNNSLYTLVVPESVLSFIRVQVANRMASNGQQWVDIFGVQNSGTYNNQWIVVDTSKLIVGSELAPGALFILEQIPGYVENADVTEILSYGYWPSYNVPYFPYVYQVSGFAKFEKNYGAFFAYEDNPRAEIFRRDSDSVINIESFKNILRYNNYRHDPLSHNTPAYAISSRFDLVNGTVTNPFLVQAAFGGIDSKVTSVTFAKNMTSFIQSGPSYDDNPPFAWTKDWDFVAHYMQPEVFNFPWVEVQYSLE